VVAAIDVEEVKLVGGEPVVADAEAQQIAIKRQQRLDSSTFKTACPILSASSG
jgi:hypothetical protein